jgi:hypothetical protein
VPFSREIRVVATISETVADRHDTVVHDGFLAGLADMRGRDCLGHVAETGAVTADSRLEHGPRRRAGAGNMEIGKRTPAAARASRFGVRISPPKLPTSVKLRSSASRSMMLGLTGIAALDQHWPALPMASHSRDFARDVVPSARTHFLLLSMKA